MWYNKGSLIYYTKPPKWAVLVCEEWSGVEEDHAYGYEDGDYCPDRLQLLVMFSVYHVAYANILL
jgi:hypothetical protein